ncbi:MAG: DUF2849 domain-containing protein [Pseudomonadota bacterium]
MAKTFHPAVLSAHDLLDGHAVWWTGSDWSPHIEAAHVAADTGARAALEATAAAPAHDAEVVGPYLVDVTLASGMPFPIVRREAIRADRQPTFAYGEQTRLRDAA